MKYEEGTVGFLIEELNKIKDKNKKVYWVETQYDDYSCYGDGFTTTFHLVDGFGDMAGFFAAITADLSGSLGQLSELVDAFFTDVSSDEDLADRYDLVNELYSVADNEQHVAAKFAELIVDRIYEYENFQDLMEQNLTLSMIRTVKVVTGHYNFKDFVVEMTPEQCYNYLRENNLVYMEEEDGNL